MQIEFVPFISHSFSSLGLLLLLFVVWSSTSAAAAIQNTKVFHHQGCGVVKLKESSFIIRESIGAAVTNHTKQPTTRLPNHQEQRTRTFCIVLRSIGKKAITDIPVRDMSFGYTTLVGT